MSTYNDRAKRLMHYAENDAYSLLEAIDALVSNIDVSAYSEVADALDNLSEMRIIEDPRSIKYRVKGQMVITYELTLTSRAEESELYDDVQQRIYGALESACDHIYTGRDEPDDFDVAQWDVLANSFDVDND